MATEYTPVPCICHGFILDKKEGDFDANMTPVWIYDSPCGEFEIETRLSYMPSLEQNFNPGEHVMCLVVMQWDSTQVKFIGVVQEASHSTLGAYSPIELSKIDLKNPNADLAGLAYSILDKKTQSGLTIEKSGAVRIVTGGAVKTVWSPDGDGVLENLHRTNAQNYMRIITDDQPFYRNREHFGLYNGSSIDEKASNAGDASDLLVSYRRYVQQSRSLDKWVSSNEGNWMPWVGANNDSTEMKNTSEIIYNKIINHGQNRITVHAGAPDDGFFTFRIDIIDSGPLRGEARRQTGGGVTPVGATKSFYLGISPEGELKAEMALKSDSPGSDPYPAASLEVSKDGEVNWKVGKSFKVNGKELLTESFLDFMVKHQLDLVQTAALGAPAPMSPGATPDFKAGQGDGEFLTNAAKNELESNAPDLKST